MRTGGAEAANLFRRLLRGKVLMMGIGNALRGDDGAGPFLCERLRDVPGLACVDAGTAPENCLGLIARERPDTLLLVDAVELDLAPGETAILRPAELDGRGFTGHDLPLSLLCTLFEGEIRGGILVLGIQPQTLVLGAPMSQAVTAALERLEVQIRAVLQAAGPPGEDRCPGGGGKIDKQSQV